MSDQKSRAFVHFSLMRKIPEKLVRFLSLQGLKQEISRSAASPF